MTLLEIAALTLDDALAAQAGGAHSVELSRDLSVGGLTPALDFVRAACESLHIGVYVMLRPHARDFVYTSAEIAGILEQAKRLSALGVSGIVFGAQTASGALDTALIKRVAHAAAPTPVTLHRALDTSADPEAALTQLIGIIPRILTAGPGASAWAGRDGLKAWIARFGGNFQFVASGGITLEQARRLADHTSAHQLHIGGAVRADGRVDAEQVRAFHAALALPTRSFPQSEDER